MLEHSDDPSRWTWIDFDFEGARRSVRSATARVAERLRATTESNQRADQLVWTVSETAAHLVVLARGYAGYARGATDSVLELDRLDASNQARIDELPERDPSVLAGDLEESIDDLLRVTDARGAHDVVPFHSHTRLPLGAVFGVLLAELLLHGRDIALAQHQRWPIEPVDALHIVRGGFAFGPLVIDQDLARTRPTTYRVRCRGVPTTTWCFADGCLTVTPSGGERVDCHLRLDAVTFVLVAFGRRSPLSAALRGRALSWGRQPLAAFRVPSYFSPSTAR